MYGTATARAREDLGIRYNDHGAYEWLRSAAPCRWRGNTKVEFRYVPFRTIRAGVSGKHPNVVSAYVNRLQNGSPIAPPVVSAAQGGTYYIHDGNHRCEAIEKLVLANADAHIRVAVVVPKLGFRFQWRWFGEYGTYILEPEYLKRYRPVDRRARPGAKVAPLLGRTMVLVAHPDDESGGCAALLQRVSEPIIVFATDGAPLDEFFWRPFGSRKTYSRIRREEARRGLAGINVGAVHFLDDDTETQFLDQQLHDALPAAMSAFGKLVRRYQPDAILAPAYEGGHPDHDACSFIAHIVGEQQRVPVWEMPLYHRAANGRIVCQRFLDANGTEVRIRCTAAELLNRNALVANYASQIDLGMFIKSKVECFRPQRKYDFSRPPHDGPANYEIWGWPISAAAVCRSFDRVLTGFEAQHGAERNDSMSLMLLSGGAQSEQLGCA